jgi:hypothetical protein
VTGFDSFSIVRLEPVRSALPPRSSGRSAMNCSSASCEALRVATVSALLAVCAIAAFTAALQPFGSSPATRRRNSAARSGFAFA